MHSAYHNIFGDPAEVLIAGEMPMPLPASGQVRVKMILSPIHNHDLLTVNGTYGNKPDLPAIGGSEAVGIIDAFGEGVSGLAVGQRVAVASVVGSWAEYFLAPAVSLVVVPDEIPDEAAAQLIAMPFSALTLLEFLEVESGDWIIQNTANGAVGKTLAMLAATLGVNVINLVRRDAGMAELHALGITNVVSTATDGWMDQVRAIAGKAQIKAGVDSVGGKSSGDLLSLIGENGTLVSFGNMTGEVMQLASQDLIYKQAIVKGFWAWKVNNAMSGETKERLFGELMRLVASGELKLPVENIFALDDISKAVTTSLKSGKVGKVLLKP